jgi:transcriptional regulator with PAS, ATPase and Fis domain/Tfp pilus assembly protein PilF
MSRTKCPEYIGQLKLFTQLCGDRDLKGAIEMARELESQFPEETSESAEFLLDKASILNQIGDYRSAIAAASEAYDLVRATSEHELLALVQAETAKAQHYLGDTGRAEMEYRDVAACYRRSGNTEGLIDTLNRIAGIRYLRADYAEARRMLDEAWGLADELHDEVRLAKISGNLGQIAIREGRFQDAVEKLSVSVEKNSNTGNSVNLARSFLSLALVEIRLANYDSARRNLTNALSIIRDNDLKRELAIYYEYRAELSIALENFDEALNCASSALEIGYAIAADGDLISQSERLKALVLFKMRRVSEAEEAANKALHVAEKIDEKLEIAECLKLLSEISDRNRRQTDSRQQFDYALSLLRELNTTFELADAYERGSRMSWLDEAGRVFYRHMAEELFDSIGLEVDLIRKPQSGAPKVSDKHVYLVAGATGETVVIVTANKQMRSVLRVVDNCRDSDIPVLITGETGTGKDLLAKYIHHSSNRSAGSFVPVNCSAIPKELAESELFGHVKGSFTNAIENKEGYISAAHGGTLFLNEIGELPLALQAKLLGCLEEKRVVRIGDTVARSVDFRLITATNRELEEDVAAGKFRQDFYFRIAVMTFELPSLRQRREDIVELVKFFMVENGLDVQDLNGLLGRKSITNILRYKWPGNVRELRNEIQLLSLEHSGDPAGVLLGLESKLKEPMESVDCGSVSGLNYQLAVFEQDRIRKALKSTNGVIRKAAQVLQIPEATLRSKMRRHKMSA